MRRIRAGWAAVALTAHRPGFPVVTSLGAVMAVVSGTLQRVVLDGSRHPVELVWAVLAMGVAVAPALMRSRFPPGAGLVGAWVYFGFTVFCLAEAPAGPPAALALVLYPMVASYLGWFFTSRAAAGTTAAALVVSGAAVAAHPARVLVVAWVDVALAAAFCVGVANHLRRRLEQLARTDPLTGVLNRGGFERRAATELGRVRHGGGGFVLVMIDIDHFKRINDADGHAAGDRVLIALTKTLTAGIRPGDTVARLGGDEFALLLPGTTFSEAEYLMATLRTVSPACFSYGLSAGAVGDTLDQVIDDADLSLYRAKAARQRN